MTTLLATLTTAVAALLAAVAWLHRRLTKVEDCHQPRLVVHVQRLDLDPGENVAEFLDRAKRGPQR